jgi:hypothetical protein
MGTPGGSPQEGYVCVLEDLTLTKLAGVVWIGHIWRTGEWLSICWNALGCCVVIEQDRLTMRTRSDLYTTWVSGGGMTTAHGRFLFCTSLYLFVQESLPLLLQLSLQMDNVAGIQSVKPPGSRSVVTASPGKIIAVIGIIPRRTSWKSWHN